MPKKPDLSDSALESQNARAGEAAVKEAMELMKENLQKSTDSLDDYEVPKISESSLKDPRAAALASEDLERIKVSRVHIPPPLPPSHGTANIAGGAAKIAAARQKLRGEQLGTGPEAHVGRVYYVECDDSDCLGPGIWIKGDPRAALTEQNWWSSYKALGSKWPANQKPYCQVCDYRHGQERPLRGISFNSIGNPGPDQRRKGLVVKPRYIRSITQAEYDQLVAPAQTA